MQRLVLPATGYRALRAHRFSSPGHVYLVTTATQDRKTVFADFHAARLAVAALNHPETLAGTTLLTWVLMPDHLHILCQLGEGDELSSLMNRIKSRIGRVVNRKLDRSGTLWQSGYHEHLVRQEEDIKGIARYIVLNPVRAGLVAKASEYPHWDAFWL